MFSLRAPELLFVDNLKRYFRWFVREKSQKKIREKLHVRFLKIDVIQLYWLDGEGYATKLRPSATEEIKKNCHKKKLANPTDNRI